MTSYIPEMKQINKMMLGYLIVIFGLSLCAKLAKKI